jgi:hypothetical protein
MQGAAAMHTARMGDRWANQARRRQKKERDRAIALEQERYDEARADWAPWREGGGDAMNRLSAAGEGDFSAFTQSPGYQFRVDEGNRAAENLWSMRSGGGNAMRALTEYNQNLASNEYGKWFDQNLAQAGMGTTGAAGTVNAGQGSAARTNLLGQHSVDNINSITGWQTGNRVNALNAGLSNALYAWDKWAGQKKEEEPKKEESTFYGGFFSDIRLKKNIRPIGESHGVNLYSWDWKDESRTGPTVGVIAQEVQRTHPEAVTEKYGYLMVDYDQLFGD